MKLLNNITPIDKDFGQWYQDVVVKGNMVSYGNTQGSMIFKPISYGIWENIQNAFNKIMKVKIKAKNVSLPLLIPISLIEKEKKHIEGFSPELAKITMVGDRELDEPLVIRPTSEVLFAQLFASEIHSYKDLPLIFNQWATIFRWEKKTKPFLRNRNFMWQEGHTSHATALEARKLAKKVIRIYQKFLEDFLSIPTITGRKTPIEKFAGAVTTYTIESMTKDGKALQAGTSHYLGQNFAKPFKIQFKDEKNQIEQVYQTSWGISTRLIGAIIMCHGDNRGIIIPPRIAPYKVDIIEIFADKNKEVSQVAKKIYNLLYRKYNPRLDNSNKGFGNKVSQSEIEGTPLRIEVGPQDIKKGVVTFVRRDTLDKEEVSIGNVKNRVKTILIEIQKNLLEKAKQRLEKNIVEASSMSAFKQFINEDKFVITPFSGKTGDEIQIKETTGATARCIISNKNYSPKKCIITNKLTNRFVVFAKAY